MKKTDIEINIGQEIRLELTKQRHSVAWLARQIKYDASNLRKILKNNNLYNEQLLLKISIALKQNFFVFYVEQYFKHIG